jgi:hypothetical protein
VAKAVRIEVRQARVTRTAEGIRTTATHETHGSLVWIKQSRSRTLLGQLVRRDCATADCKRPTATPDAPVQLIAQAGESGNAVVQSALHAAGKLFPFRAAGVRSPGQRFANRSQWNTRALRHFDDRDTTEHFAGIASLVSTIPPALDEPLRFIEMKRRERNATAYRDFACSQCAMQTWPALEFIFPTTSSEQTGTVRAATTSGSWLYERTTRCFRRRRGRQQRNFRDSKRRRNISTVPQHGRA